MQKQSEKKINKPAKFIRTLYSMFQIPDCFLEWNQNQEDFRITNIPLFISKILPKFFRHKNITSFVRQLNLYGFKKVTDQGSPQNSYRHPNFKKGRFRLLSKIKRKNLHKKSIKSKLQVKIEEEDSKRNQTKNKIKQSILQCQKQLKVLRDQNVRLLQQGKNLRYYMTEICRQNQNFINVCSPPLTQFAYNNFSNIYNYYQQYQSSSPNWQHTNFEQIGMLQNSQQQPEDEKYKQNDHNSQNVSQIQK